ncbi:hypothetical protein [Burkholderia cepacia]|uniref:hypothetical protein n=1 Tax=Burkholderia cepacia TaxID=292 RepID=UPI002AB67571|nr:hypothetical protein [Burkholderia cepacia]
MDETYYCIGKDRKTIVIHFDVRQFEGRFIDVELTVGDILRLMNPPRAMRTEVIGYRGFAVLTDGSYSQRYICFARSRGRSADSVAYPYSQFQEIIHLACSELGL